jgi:hypothetical protein
VLLGIEIEPGAANKRPWSALLQPARKNDLAAPAIFVEDDESGRDAAVAAVS